MKNKSTKITNKEITQRLNYLLMELHKLQDYQGKLFQLVNDYVEYKGDLDGLSKHIEKKNKEAKISGTRKTTSKK
jgi:geranylgeranyl pyrophosphate synthase